MIYFSLSTVYSSSLSEPNQIKVKFAAEILASNL